MIEIDGNHLTIDDVVAVSRQGVEVALTQSARENMEQSCRWVTEIANAANPVYGINTGFGIFSDRDL